MSESMTGTNRAIERPCRGAVASGSENSTEETCRLPRTLKVARPVITQKGYPAVSRAWSN